jgi:hypothetical protein
MKPREIPSMQLRGAPGFPAPGFPASTRAQAESASGAVRIDRDVPLPRHQRRSIAFPFDAMSPGDSFHVMAKHAGVSAATRAWRKRTGKNWRFTVRPEKGGTRCWRVS